MSVTYIKKTLMNGMPVSVPFNGHFHKECDIAVVGLGTSGAIAAIAAAKRGLSVIGIDKAPIPGGVGAAACVWDYYFGAVGGLYTEVNAKANEIVGTSLYFNSTDGKYKRSYTTPVKSMALETFFDDNKIECLYSATVTDVICEETDGGRQKVAGIVIYRNDGFIAVHAKAVIDGAEGSVCRLLGLKNLGGRRSDNKSARFSRTVGVKANGRILGRWCFCGDYANSTPESAAALTYEWAAKEPCLQEKFTESSRLYALGCEIGKREVPCYETERVYTFADYFGGERTKYPVSYSFSPLDNSNPDQWNEDEDFQDWMSICDLHSYGVSVGISADMLLPKNVDGLVLAGKHIGTGHVMTSTVRMRTDLEKIGEAAGVLTAMMCEKDCNGLTVCRDYYGELKDTLTATGCLNPDNDCGFCNLNTFDGNFCTPYKLPETVEEIKTALASIHPAPALYMIRGGLTEVREELAAWSADETNERLLRENAAVALGLLGDRRCLPMLYDILAHEPVRYVYESPERYHFPWLFTTELKNYVKATCLVGRLDRNNPILDTIAAYDGEEPQRIKAAAFAKSTIAKR